MASIEQLRKWSYYCEAHAVFSIFPGRTYVPSDRHRRGRPVVTGADLSCKFTPIFDSPFDNIPAYYNSLLWQETAFDDVNDWYDFTLFIAKTI